MSQAQQQKHVVVIGAGVIGLSAALLLQQSGHAVTIVAEHFPGPFETMHPQEHINYASAWAGAHNRWVPPPPPSPSSSPSSSSPSPSAEQAALEHRLALATYRHMKSLSSSSPLSSVRFMKGIEYLESPTPEYLALTEERAVGELGMEGFRLLTAEELPGGGGVVKWGCEYDTWCLNPMVYCLFLLRRFVRNGGGLVRRKLAGVGEVFQLGLLPAGPEPDWNRGLLVVKDCGGEQPRGVKGGGTWKERVRRVDAVVNASGVGFGDDPNMFVTRGQTCVVAEGGGCEDDGASSRKPVTVTRQNANGSWSFSIPRGADGGTVVGGTKEPDNYDPMPCPLVRERLLENIVVTQPELLAPGRSRLTPIRDIVGRRPTRKGGPRIEVEVLSVGGQEGSGGFVMHAYGLGGRGYELSWGVAERVVEGVAKYFLSQEEQSGVKTISKL